MDFLPIGTVVLLKKSTKPVMIYGRKQLNSSTNEIFDYVACLYPEGNISSNYNIFFNHSQIEEVLFYGYDTPEERKLQITLKQLR